MDVARRYIEVLAFVALWMALGWIFHLDTNSYLLIGVPLVVLFQRFVRQRPLRQLWVRDAAAFRLGLVGSVIAVLLILAPGYDLIIVAVPTKSWIVVLWFLCAVAGAVFAAFAITQQRASAARRALPSFISAVLIGVAIMTASALASRQYQCAAFKAVFVIQAVLTLLYGHLRARGGCVSRSSRFPHLSASN